MLFVIYQLQNDERFEVSEMLIYYKSFMSIGVSWKVMDC